MLKQKLLRLIGKNTPPPNTKRIEAELAKKRDKENAMSNLLIQVEQPFNDLYERGMKITSTPESGAKRKARFYNLVHFLSLIDDLEGDVVECGCWKGLSSFLICNYIKKNNPSFSGEKFHVMDSFEGLSEPKTEDIIQESIVDRSGDRRGKAFKGTGAYSAQLEEVQTALSDFPAIRYYKGWLPEALNQFKAEKVKFAHIDLDLYEPILGSLEFFNKILVPGGIIICDDYGSLYWPGAKKAVEEFSAKNSFTFIPLSTGQAVFIKR